MATGIERKDRVTSARRRYWRRLREPLDEWWPWGWLLLAALFVLFFAGTFVLAPAVERAARAAVVAALDSAGFEVADARASGQRVSVLLSGMPDPQRALVQARAVARGAECASWAGPLVCPTWIHIQQLPVDRATTEEETGSAPDGRPAPRYHDLVLTLDGDRLRVSGEVDSEDSKLWVLARIRSAFPEAEEALSVSGDAATPMFRSAVDRGLSLLAPLLRGSVNWRSGQLTLEGLVEPEQLAAAQAAYAAVEPALNPQPPRLTTARSLDRCTIDFAAALQEATINFATASASISADSAALLDRLTELAAVCPGGLVVEGHTDDRGQATANLELSRRRAAAVRLALIERGVSAARLRAEGFGEAQPVDDNDTASGRARNRRIVVRPDL